MKASTRPDGRREQRKRSTRTQLLVAGRQLFGEKGLYESRIEDLAQVAGIAKGTLYGYFSDKEALVHAVVTAGFEELLAAVRRAAPGPPGARPRVERLVRAHFEFFAENPDLMRIFHQVRGLLKFHRPEWRILRDALESYLEALALLLDPRRPGQGPRVRPSTEAAELVFGAVSGIASVRASLGIDFAGPRAADSTVTAVAALYTAVRRPLERRSQDRRGRAHFR